MDSDAYELSPEAYALVRGERRAEAITLRRARRVRLGDLVMLEFENAATLRYQAQEMLYVERVTDPNAAAAEVGVYERLRPTGSRLTATMFIEIDDPDRVREELGRLNGLHDAIRLEVGDAVCPARDIPPPEEGPSTHTVSVHFLGFDLSDAVIGALRDGSPARLVVDHPALQAGAELDPSLVTALLGDLADA
jgi:glycerol-3-phosphate dehydrogenase subunit C